MASSSSHIDKVSAHNVKYKKKNFHKDFSNKSSSQSLSNVDKGFSKSTGKTCHRCGNEGHFAYHRDRCPATGKKCSNCNNLGHFATQCRYPKSTKKINTATENISVPKEKDVNPECQSKGLQEDDFAFQINLVNHKGRLMVEVLINNRLITLQVDTAADVTIMSESVADTIPNLTITKCNKRLKDYNNVDIEVVGAANVDVQYGTQKVSSLPLTIVKGIGQTLLGLNLLKYIKLDWPNILNVRKPNHDAVSVDKVLSQYNEVFEDKVGTVKNVRASLVLKPEATPKFCNPRPVPYAIKTQVEVEIKRLESEGAWEKVQTGQLH